MFLTLVLGLSYGEAHKIKLKSDALEAWELDKWRALKQQEALQREATFKQRQKQDLDALAKRVQSGREEQKKQRQVDLERCVRLPPLLLYPWCLLCTLLVMLTRTLGRLLQRYQNVKAELQQQQNLERIRYEKGAQRPAPISESTNSAAVWARG